MKNPFKKEKNDEQRATEYLEEERNPQIREQRLQKQRIEYARREEEKAQQIEHARQDVRDKYRKDSKPKNFGAAGSLYNRISKIDSQKTYSSRRIRYKRGAKISQGTVGVEGQTPIPEARPFDNRFSHLFDVSSSPMKFGSNVGRNYSELTTIKKAKRRPW